MKLVATIKKHQKPIMIGAGILLVMHLMKKSSSGSSIMPIGPTTQELKAINGSLGSLG